MPHPIPIIIGTTIAVAATGYALKKFVYDPHLAPVIEAFIEQQREVRRRRRLVPVSVDQGRNEGRVEGRTTAVARVRQRAGDQYELDESMAHVGAPASYNPRRRKPVPQLESPRVGPVGPADEAVSLIAIDNHIEKDLPPLPQPLPVPHMENPFADSASPARSLSPTVSPMPSSATSAASTTLSRTTLIEAPSSPSMSGLEDIDVVSVSGASYIDAEESYTPRSLSPYPSSRASPAPESVLTFPSPSPVTSMLGSNLTFPAPDTTTSAPLSSHTSPRASTPTSGRVSPRDDVLSVSSWTEDEWRSETEAESEWDAVSDAPSR
ncbi:hypothetical protein CcaverHIS002_0608050 [Cutaneotrichosporon cavernicola]|uniref:Uncharacterized protein n=1 Tax=Cutaneotrichosporon cavernicola TaxID=279322 RepID=A0AA48QYD7_9TREE|nr:uncharacterized protein CcaverHIS019_0607500 [Cutaneotrichosporon cavernicola]BEI86518.1 hypothetical protein CcaverHIS002_0608050 [Cutaneotrichosporon cavernicola]BEI94291.1 hypothetical protein CcaverHIS019_0607500 [Cutaneotrichosporon cavernicola]BEJ02068.1 hypothetical protein CcaverHIS631_0607500 [Cutaneotrichosporon cavernicola]BEJ09831.1 hypothetical protein CcaverHIS641_0607460 [Cutaneotrichosporon cavernicola]